MHPQIGSCRILAHFWPLFSDWASRMQILLASQSSHILGAMGAQLPFLFSFSTVVSITCSDDIRLSFDGLFLHTGYISGFHDFSFYDRCFPWFFDFDITVATSFFLMGKLMEKMKIIPFLSPSSFKNIKWIVRNHWWLWINPCFVRKKKDLSEVLMSWRMMDLQGSLQQQASTLTKLTVLAWVHPKFP